jgi:hypothetical protein
MSPSQPLLHEAIAECEQKIRKLEDPRWPWLMEAIRQGVAANKQQHQGVEYAAEITIAIDQDYLTALRSILDAAGLHTTKRAPDAGKPKAHAPNAEDFDLGDQGQSGG